MKHEFVYAITIGGKTKVGMTSSPDKRVKTIIRGAGATESECEVTVVCVSNKSACEIAAHEILSSSKIVGEWFLVCHSDAVAAIRAANQATECVITSKKRHKIQTEAETELLGLRAFSAKSRVDMESAAFELSRYGDVEPVIAASIASAAYLDDHCFNIAVNNAASWLHGWCLDMVNATHEYLKEKSIDMLSSGDCVNARIVKLCSVDTDAITSAYAKTAS